MNLIRKAAIKECVNTKRHCGFMAEFKCDPFEINIARSDRNLSWHCKLASVLCVFRHLERFA